MDKREQEYPAVYKNQEEVSGPLQSLYDVMQEARDSKNDYLQLQECQAAIGLILEVRERLLLENPNSQRIVTLTKLTVEAAEVRSHSQIISTAGGVSDNNEYVSEAPLQMGRGNPNFRDQDFLERFAQLNTKINQQLASLQDTIQTNRKAADRLSGSTKNLAAGLCTIKGELSGFKLKPEPES